MKIAVYANEIAQAGNYGVKTYALELLRAMPHLEGAQDLTFFAQSGIGKNFSVPIREVVLPPRRWWLFRAFTSRVREIRPDVVFMPIQTYPFLRKPNFKVVVTIHDLAFERFSKHFTFLRRILLKFHTKRAARLADRIIVPSQATKRDLVKFYGVKEEKITVISLAFSGNFAKLGRKNAPEVAQLSQKSPYLLFVGVMQPRKNLVRLVEAFELVAEQAPELRLVLCGARGWMAEATLRRVQTSAQRARIVLTGRVAEPMLADLYANAEMLVFPSLYEGFGLPILEAMSCGLPVVCAKNSSLGEVAGRAALYFDEYNPGDMAEKILKVHRDAKMRALMREKGLVRARQFSWEKTAQKTWEVLKF